MINDAIDAIESNTLLKHKVIDLLSKNTQSILESTQDINRLHSELERCQKSNTELLRELGEAQDKILKH